MMQLKICQIIDDKLRVFIDPSIGTLGIAMFKGKQPIKVGLIKTDRRADDITRMFELVRKINDFSKGKKIDAYYVEHPEFRFRDTNKKDIERLKEVVGFLTGYYYCLGGKVEHVKVSDWKGHRDKLETKELVDSEYPEVTEAISSITKDKNLQLNIYDAIGIGIYVVSLARQTA